MGVRQQPAIRGQQKRAATARRVDDLRKTVFRVGLAAGRTIARPTQGLLDHVLGDAVGRVVDAAGSAGADAAVHSPPLAARRDEPPADKPLVDLPENVGRIAQVGKSGNGSGHGSVVERVGVARHQSGTEAPSCNRDRVAAANRRAGVRVAAPDGGTRPSGGLFARRRHDPRRTVRAAPDGCRRRDRPNTPRSRPRGCRVRLAACQPVPGEVGTGSFCRVLSAGSPPKGRRRCRSQGIVPVVPRRHSGPWDRRLQAIGWHVPEPRAKGVAASGRLGHALSGRATPRHSAEQESPRSE